MALHRVLDPLGLSWWMEGPRAPGALKGAESPGGGPLCPGHLRRDTTLRATPPVDRSSGDPSSGATIIQTA